ncbi:YqaA family protein [Bartonella ancashensis]|uniref:Lipoprotein B n=1 Tax=Bartonella ancashensis TaxID=1318743 RepID=A0A0M5KSC9_9HYPH|nr:YqaA family protein [Bartonella ancashensis]ALE03098.1 lipoprotein B [Bartonella ancashensis]
MKNSIKQLKAWTISLGKRQTAPYWLGLITFAESFVFPIPGDVLYIPMSLLHPQRAYRYAFIATICSVFGGIVGWYIGAYAYETIAKPILEFYGKYDDIQSLKNHVTLEFMTILLLISGLSHIPPIKIVTLLSGMMFFPLWLFVLICILSRGARFYCFAWLIQRFGHKMLSFLSKKWKMSIFIGIILFGVACVLYFIFFKSYLLS